MKILTEEPYNLGDAITREIDDDATALIDLGGENTPRAFSFRQLDEMSNGVARRLTMSGLQRGDRVAIISANRAEYLMAFFGIMRAGFVAVPVNYKLPRATIDYLLRDCQAKLAFCDEQRAQFCGLELPKIVFGRNTEDGFTTLIAPGPFTSVRPGINEPAMFLYTSGSSGTPKGVVLSHQSHLWVLRVRPRAADPQRVLVAAPLYHMNALATCQAMTNQGNMIIMLPTFTAPTYIEAIQRYRCTLLTAVPPMIAMMLREREQLQRADLSCVKSIRMGSAPVSQTLLHATRAAMPNAAISNAYGTTEAGPVVFISHPQGLPQPELSVGYPHPEVQVRLVDEANWDAAEGVLHIRCPGLLNHYHNLPDATRSAITQDGFYITGDVFRRDDPGFFYFVGRADDMFVSGGENVYPGEVEKMLERHPEIHQACVVPIADDIKGTKPVAFIVKRPKSELTEQEVKEFALANAAPYLHPRRVWFLNDLPLGGTTKIDRKALARQAAEALTEPSR